MKAFESLPEQGPLTETEERVEAKLAASAARRAARYANPTPAMIARQKYLREVALGRHR